MKTTILILTLFLLIGCGTQDKDGLYVDGYSDLVGSWYNCFEEDTISTKMRLEFKEDLSFWINTETYSTQKCVGFLIESSRTGGWHVDNATARYNYLTFTYSKESPRSVDGKRYYSPRYTFVHSGLILSEDYQDREFEKEK